MTLPPDMVVRPICISIGIISFVVNSFTIFLIVKHRKIYSSNIFGVFIVLQILYLIQNFHFSILFIPFLYSTLGGGYCIGLLCEPHFIPFHVHYVAWIFLIVLLCGFFILLIFYRHQNLLPESSALKLRPRTIFSVSLLFYMSVPAFRYAVLTYNLDDRKSQELLKTLCPNCQFIEEDRNFGVISQNDSIISAVLILIITGSCAIFAFLCGGHIMHLMTKYRDKVNVRTTINLRQTLLSLIQIVVFGTFLAVPIGTTVLMIWIGQHDFIFACTLFLLSVNSLVNSLMVIVGTPPFRRYIKYMIIRKQSNLVVLNLIFTGLLIVFDEVFHYTKSLSESCLAEENRNIFLMVIKDLYGGDIALNEDQKRQFQPSPRPIRQAYLDDLYPSTIWKDGLPYFINNSLPSEAVVNIMKAIYFWGNNTCVNLRPRKNERIYVAFENNNDGCYAPVGRDTSVNKNVVNIGAGCYGFGTTSHELAHSLGLYHHHQRFDRDQSISYNKTNVANRFRSNFDTIPDFFLTTYDLPYDVGSVMHYGPEEYALNTSIPVLTAKDIRLQSSMGNLDGPTFIDVALINNHYKCAQNCNTSDPLNCTNGGYPDPRNCSICKCPSLFGGRLCSGRESSSLSSCGGILTASSLLRRLSVQLEATQGQKETCNFMISVAEYLGTGYRILMAVENVSTTCVQGCHLGGMEMKPLEDVRPVGYRYCCNVTDDSILSHSDRVPLSFSVMGGNSTSISLLFKAVPSNFTLNGTDSLIGQSIPNSAVVIAQNGPGYDVKVFRSVDQSSTNTTDTKPIPEKIACKTEL